MGLTAWVFSSLFWPTQVANREQAPNLSAQHQTFFPSPPSPSTRSVRDIGSGGLSRKGMLGSPGNGVTLIASIRVPPSTTRHIWKNPPLMEEETELEKTISIHLSTCAATTHDELTAYWRRIQVVHGYRPRFPAALLSGRHSDWTGVPPLPSEMFSCELAPNPGCPRIPMPNSGCSCSGTDEALT